MDIKIKVEKGICKELMVDGKQRLNGVTKIDVSILPYEPTKVTLEMLADNLYIESDSIKLVKREVH